MHFKENSFKDRFNSHQNTFRNRDKISSAELSKFIWDLQDKNIDNVEMDWPIVWKTKFTPVDEGGSGR